MKKREVVISINDYCKEPFEEVDLIFWRNNLSEALENYDVEITKVEVRNVDETRTVDDK